MGTPSGDLGSPPTALTIAGSDSGGGAGIQADLKVFMAMGCHGMSAITALTAQNTTGVHGVWNVPPEFVVQQIEAVASDLGVAAAKTGMLSSAPIVHVVADAIERLGIRPLVVDPVFASKHGSRLLEDDAVAALSERLLHLAALVTPNLHEAEGLVGGSISSLEDMKEAAHELHALGPDAVLLKGGHLPDSDHNGAVDVFLDDDGMTELIGPRYDTADTHGTGCTLAAACAARLAHGDTTLDAARAAKEFVDGAIKRSLRLGRGFGPVNPAWRLG
jgi:hydroxymethylpyrimidine/phosphomethylpyrimidine kinase